MKRLISLVAVMTALGALAGCQNWGVHPGERDLLAKPVMTERPYCRPISENEPASTTASKRGECPPG